MADGVMVLAGRRMFRKNLMDSRDGAIATLAAIRNEKANPILIFRD